MGGEELNPESITWQPDRVSVFHVDFADLERKVVRDVVGWKNATTGEITLETVVGPLRNAFSLGSDHVSSEDLAQALTQVDATFQNVLASVPKAPKAPSQVSPEIRLRERLYEERYLGKVLPREKRR